MDIKGLQNANRYEDLFILARYLYRIGRPIMNDTDYDKLEKTFRQHGVLSDYLNRTYDDDPIPVELLKELNLEHFIIEQKGSKSKYVSALDEEKSLSIRAVTSIDEVFSFVEGVRGQDLIMSLKLDGVNSKSLYVNGDFELCLSRARAGEGIDYTKNIRNILPSKINNTSKFTKVFSESFVFESYLPTLRELDPSSYKTPKSSALSLLRVTHGAEHYKYLKSLAFAVEGVDGLNTKEDEFKYLKDNGFETAPYVVFKSESIPKDRILFEKWLLKVCDLFHSKTLAVPSDGLVFEVNDLSYDATINNQYSTRNIAIKLSHWKHKKSKGIVEDIILEQRRVKASCRVKIKSTQTADGCSADYINVFNPSIIISQGITIGSEIEFERNSGAVNCLLYGKRLDAFD